MPPVRFSGHINEWKNFKVSEITEIYDNLRIPIAASEREYGKTPYYGANGIQDYVNGYTHDGEFVLIAEDGANDLINYPVNYVRGKIWVNNHAHVLSGRSNVLNNSFLAVRIKAMNISKFLVGGGRAKLNGNILKDISLQIPSIDEQTKIGNFFKQLDESIELQEKKVERLKQVKKSFLQKMFV